MAGEGVYVVRLAGWLARALGASAGLFERFSTEELGLGLPQAVIEAPAVVTALEQAAASAVRVQEAGAALEAVAGSEEETEILVGFVRLGTELGTFFVALDGLVDGVGASVTAATVPDAAARAEAEGFAGVLAERIATVALGAAITMQAPQFAYVLRLLGLLDWRRVRPVEGSTLAFEHVRVALELDRLEGLISDPAAHYRETLGWGEPEFDPSDIFSLTRDFFGPEDDVEVGVDRGEPFLRIGAFSVRRDASAPPPAPPGMLLSLVAAFEADRSARVRLNDEWGVGVASDLRMSGTISALLTPPLEVDLRPPEGQIGGTLRVLFDRNEEARPFDIVDGTGLVSVKADNLVFGIGIEARWQASTPGSASVDPLVFADIDGLALKLGASDADSFIGSLLAAAEIEGEFDLGLEWQASTGLRVKASGGIEIALPMHRQLGPIELQTLYLALRILPDGTLSLEASTALSGTLGPLSASVDRLGAKLDLRLVEGADARFGPFDVQLAFKPPNGIGLAVDAGAVKGGGYLYIDTEKGEYAGALELVFSNFLTLRAIGLITTRNPDGSPGFSLLILISVEFGTGLQLGFGFTLLAVGGLLGLNRTMRLQALAEGVRSGAIDSVMFPRDVVANAPRIISDLKTFFPQQDGRFLIGPMAKIGWGSPTLISLSLGIIIEIPGNLAILGVLRVALPTDEAAVVKIQINFLGAIEFDRKRVYFFAALFDSRVLFITLEGEMALLAAFGDDANFVLSVGGFHPRFEPPPLPVPTPRRFALVILNETNARVRVAGYMAVTSNTVQFGAAVELFFGFDAFAVEGNLGFDALLQFSPLYFIIEVSCSFSLRAFGIDIIAIRVRLSLEGPTPWRARGSGSLSLLFFEISADFDVTWGEERRTELPPVEVMPLLSAELDKDANWQARLPAGTATLVALRKLDDDGDAGALVLHPAGTLRVSQRVAPLNAVLDKLGNQQPSDARRFALNVAAGGLVKHDDAREQFASAQFFDLDDAKKLELPAFEDGHGGIDLSVAEGDLAAAALVKRVNRYELITIDTAGRRVARRLQPYTPVLFAHFLGGASVTRSPLSKARRDKVEPFADKVAVHGERFVVAHAADNTARSSVFASKALARDHLAQVRARDASLADDLHVIAEFEMVA